MELNIDALSIQNPWWKGSKMKFDPTVLAFFEQPLKWKQDLLDIRDLKNDAVYILSGGRLTGKTTMIKLLIDQLIASGQADPRQILYYSCHNIDSYEHLNEAIKVFIKQSRKDPQDRLYIFIDEASLVQNWQKGIEYLHKAGILENISLLLATSMLYQGKSSGTPPLNIDNIEERHLVSLSFRDFLSLLNPGLIQPADARLYSQFQNQLDYYLDVFLLTGGYPSAINSFKRRGAVDQDIYEIFLAWFIADLAKMGRDISLGRQIMENLILNLCRSTGYKTLANKTKAKTHITIEEYINIYQQLIVITPLFQGDTRGALNRSKAKKFYFNDPFLFWIFYGYVHGSVDYWQFSREYLHKENIFQALLENIVWSELRRREGNTGQPLFFWKNSAKKAEIDLVSRENDSFLPIMIKYGQKASDKDQRAFAQAGFGQGLIITKDILDLSGPVRYMPLTYFLLKN